ncbi:hypothetical protein E3H47_04935 [Acinetobacter radioresistens]|uniref:hypothetical protein n=1 Tax=Acinetobacter radioresistens TaxID=40216 RepID=UPI0010CD1D43|nr:hypothetical protein [Acinetobacter radioresistens]QCS11887.1 hypothetical protein E3H47_04865 [Acinetobacter radioresistens]QCS11899.1 hypothetical protein E3H47_04935 [Acinetobacter radioresistens]
MLVILLLLALFVPALCFRSSVKIPNDVQMQKAIAPLLLGALIAGAISLVVGVYTFLQMRKMQKKNQPKPNQLDGTIADEGISFYDLAGSPHVHTNITDIWDKDAQAIKKKSGGFLGMGKTSQVTGYRYYAKFAAFIGNRIEKLIAINFDNRKWVVHDPLKHPPNLLPVLEGNLFGEDEGGVSGNIDIHFGYPDQEPNAEYQKYFPLVSGYPYQSYLVFRGLNVGQTLSTSPHGFYLGNSGYMKEMLLWVKRIHVRNSGDMQWHDIKSEIGDNMPYSSLTGEFTNNGVVFKVSGKRKIPEGIEVTATTNCIGGITGEFSYSVHTAGLPGTTASDALKERYGILDIFRDLELRFEGYKGSSDTGIFLDHADFWYPNWETVKDKKMINKVSVKSVGFPALYLIELKSRTRQTDFSIKMASLRSYVLSNIQVGNFKDGYVEGRYLAVILDAGDTINIGFSTENDLDADTRLQIRSHIQCQVVDLEIIEGGSSHGPDINPIHKIREILTDDTAMGKPESDVNDANFMKAADRIWNEGLGISWAIDEKSCIDAIEELCYHIEAGVRVNRQTGLYEMVLFRDDWFSEEEIHDITENKIKNLSLEIMNSDDIVNQLNVTYYDRKRIKNSAFSVYENGSILTMGHVNAESVDFPYFMNMRNAEIVANWKLKQFSTPAWSGSFTTGWREARKWNRYDLIRLPWSKKWNGTILVRIMKINLGNGTDNTVTIDFEEIVPYSGEMNTSIVADESLNQGALPPQPAPHEIFEAPYYLTVLKSGQVNADLELSNNPEIGYVAAIAAKPQSNSLSALLYTDGSTGEFEEASRLDYCDILQLDQAIDEATHSFTVTGSLTQPANSNNLILLNGELMGFVSFDAETKILTVKRGVLDTVPKKHNSGDLFVFDLPDVAFDSAQYSRSEIVQAQVLTTTPSGVQELAGNGENIEIQARAIRPYPPANVKINGEYWPEDIETDLIITWSDRNRLSQDILDWFDSSIAIEPGTQTHLILTQLDENNLEVATTNANVTGTTSYTMPISSMQAATRTVSITLKTVRDGYECLNLFMHTVELSQFFSAPYNLTVEFKND